MNFNKLLCLRKTLDSGTDMFFILS